ncbi:MAG: cytochrome-c oxidase, cbb3-type subunit III [Pseudomonadota bacterium]
MSEKQTDEITGVETTGHEWDGIKELNNPLPRWWLIVFYATCVWSFVYWVFMPAWPGIAGHTQGLRNHSERENVAVAIAELETQRAGLIQGLAAAPDLASIEGDPELLQLALAAGESAFGDNCATCHGAGGQGFVGYPSLVDDVWLWGGRLDDIRQTLLYGIRNEHPETRYSLMQAYGRDGLLTRDEIADLVEYVTHMSGRNADLDAVARAAPIYEQQCVSCHGPAGMGDQTQGAPNLTDAVWLYGGSREAIYDTLWNGRGGVMPGWENRLDETTITALAVYVHALGGGE